MSNNKDLARLINSFVLFRHAITPSFLDVHDRNLSQTGQSYEEPRLREFQNDRMSINKVGAIRLISVYFLISWRSSVKFQ